MSQSATIRVALVEDDDELREATIQTLALADIDVAAFADGVSALEELSEDFDGVVVSDIRMPGIDGLELFSILSERDPELPVILVTGHGDVSMAVEAMKQGAADFLTKPFPASALVEAVKRAAAKRSLVIENRHLRDALRHRESAGLLGTCDAVRRLDRLVTEVARTDLDVRVTGGPGMGKSRLAQRIHELSARHDRPFVTIDMGVWSNSDAELLIFGRDRAAGLSRSGLIERAQGGTLLLDDAETIPENLRGQIRALVEKRSFHPLGAERPRAVDIRIIAAKGSQTLTAGLMADGLLIDHLGGVTISIPSFEERREDLAVIFRYFIAQFEREFSTTSQPLTSEEWNFLLRHDWPGGVREVRDFARAFVLGLTRLAGPNSEFATANSSLQQLVADFEKTVLEDTLTIAKGQISKVQSLLSIKRKTLYDKLSRYAINPKDFR